MALAPPILPPQQRAGLFLAARGQSRLLQAHLLCVFARQTQNRPGHPPRATVRKFSHPRPPSRRPPPSSGVGFLQPGRPERRGNYKRSPGAAGRSLQSTRVVAVSSVRLDKSENKEPEVSLSAEGGQRREAGEPPSHLAPLSAEGAGSITNASLTSSLCLLSNGPRCCHAAQLHLQGDMDYTEQSNRRFFQWDFMGKFSIMRNNE